MDTLERCPECGAHLTSDDIIEGSCPHCDFVFEEDTGDLLDDLERDETDKLDDIYDEDALEE